MKFLLLVCIRYLYHILDHIHIINLHNNVWDEISFFAKIPDNLQKDDTVSLSIWNFTQNPLRIRSMRMALYR